MHTVERSLSRYYCTSTVSWIETRKSGVKTSPLLLSYVKTLIFRDGGFRNSTAVYWLGYVHIAFPVATVSTTKTAPATTVFKASKLVQSHTNCRSLQRWNSVKPLGEMEYSRSVAFEARDATERWVS